MAPTNRKVTHAVGFAVFMVGALLAWSLLVTGAASLWRANDAQYLRGTTPSDIRMTLTWQDLERELSASRSPNGPERF